MKGCLEKNFFLVGSRKQRVLGVWSETESVELNERSTEGRSIGVDLVATGRPNLIIVYEAKVNLGQHWGEPVRQSQNIIYDLIASNEYTSLPLSRFSLRILRSGEFAFPDLVDTCARQICSDKDFGSWLEFASEPVSRKMPAASPFREKCSRLAKRAEQLAILEEHSLEFENRATLLWAEIASLSEELGKVSEIDEVVSALHSAYAQHVKRATPKAVVSAILESLRLICATEAMTGDDVDRILDLLEDAGIDLNLPLAKRELHG